MRSPLGSTTDTLILTPISITLAFAAAVEVSLIATLREEGRLPIGTIQWYLKMVHGLKLSVGAIVRAVHHVARLGMGALEEILERIRGSPVVHADETGWREEGTNGYVWISTSTERYFLRRGRGKGVVDEVLGETFSGVLVSDFYAAYDHYPGLKQRCWAHLLRDIHELKVLYPEDLGEVGSGSASALRQGGLGCRLSQGQLVLEEGLLALCRLFLEDSLAPQGRLCRRIEKHIKELFVFVSHPQVPSDNNAAERSLRHSILTPGKYRPPPRVISSAARNLKMLG